jgi:predicted PurR-regulated permease PerM
MDQETLNTLVAVVIVPVLAAVVPMVVAAINVYAKKLKNEITDQRLHKYVDIAEDAVETAVVSVYQTFVNTLKTQGDWNAETQKVAFDAAKNKALAIMGVTTKAVLEEVYDDFDAWIENKIEFYVNIGR